jgi:DNA-binding MltR family transcriptional regulator
MTTNEEMIEALKRENAHFFDAGRKESDRGFALVAAEFFDVTLERLLLARFASSLKNRPGLIKPLFEGFGPLSTFSSKISVSYGIDLLQSWMAYDLDIVRRIRNEFAHTLEPKTFRDPKLSQMVDQLTSVTKVTKDVERLQAELVLELGRPQTPAETSRLNFYFVCIRIGALLQAKVVVMESDGPEEMKRSYMANPEL